MELLSAEEFEARKDGFMAEHVARKNPNHEKWKDSAFDMADASTRLRFLPNGTTLIYWDGEDHSKNIILPAVVVKCIVDHYSTRI